MSWANALLETYENNVGKYGEEKRTLAPISHTYVNVQLELTLNGDGEFVSAVVLPPDDEQPARPNVNTAAARILSVLFMIFSSFFLFLEKECRMRLV